MTDETDDVTVYEFVDDTTRRLAHLAGIAQDLATTMVNCQNLKTHLDDIEMSDDMKRSMWLTALVHYRRAFDTAAGIDLSAEALMSNLNGDPMGAHRQYLDLLHKQSAPVEDPFQRVRVGLTMKTLDGEPESITGAGVYYMETSPAHRELVEQLEMLAGAIHDEVLRQGEQAEADVIKAAGKHSLEELAALPRFNPMAGHDHDHEHDHEH